MEVAGVEVEAKLRFDAPLPSRLEWPCQMSKATLRSRTFTPHSLNEDRVPAVGEELEPVIVVGVGTMSKCQTIRWT